VRRRRRENPTRLEKLFDELNAKLFDGVLPQTIWLREQAQRYGVLAQCNRWGTEIVIAPSLSRASERRALVHEMVHSYLALCGHRSAEHGPKFQKELRRIAKLAEPWAEREARRSKEQGEVANTFRALATKAALEVAREEPDLLWERAIGRIAQLADLSPRQILISGVDLQRIWQMEGRIEILSKIASKSGSRL
jgi:SprT-like family protein